jgi:hypothetical protein
MNDIEKILGEMEAYVEMHAKGWGSKDAAKDHLSQHALCYSATQYLPRLIAAVRILVGGAVADLGANHLSLMRQPLEDVHALLTGDNETTGTESNDAN